MEEGSSPQPKGEGEAERLVSVVLASENPSCVGTECVGQQTKKVTGEGGGGTTQKEHL